MYIKQRLKTFFGENMTFSQIRELFDKRLSQMNKKLGTSYRVYILLDLGGEYPKARDYAQCTLTSIYVSRKILDAPQSRVDGLLMHELGHIALMRAGILDHSERGADIIAEYCFGQSIYYDEDGVQSSSQGVTPRPMNLPQ